MRRALLAVPLLAACDAGPVEETLLDELRVIAAVTEPAAPAPGEQTALSVLAADPKGEGAEVLAWMCTPTGSGCLEASDHALEGWVATGLLDDERASLDLIASPLLAPLLVETEDPLPIPLWTLACTPGTCPIIDQARDALASGAPSADLLAALADPASWLADLPLDGVSLAVLSLPVDDADVRPTNPAIVEVVLDDRVAPEGEVELLVTVDSNAPAVRIAPYATAGGFGAPLVDVVDGEAALTFFAPEDEGAVTLYLVVEDVRGGAATWRGAVTVTDRAR